MIDRLGEQSVTFLVRGCLLHTTKLVWMYSIYLPRHSTVQWQVAKLMHRDPNEEMNWMTAEARRQRVPRPGETRAAHRFCPFARELHHHLNFRASRSNIDLSTHEASDPLTRWAARHRNERVIPITARFLTPWCAPQRHSCRLRQRPYSHPNQEDYQRVASQAPDQMVSRYKNRAAGPPSRSLQQMSSNRKPLQKTPTRKPQPKSARYRKEDGHDSILL